MPGLRQPLRSSLGLRRACRPWEEENRRVPKKVTWRTVEYWGEEPSSLFSNGPHQAILITQAAQLLSLARQTCSLGGHGIHCYFTFTSAPAGTVFCPEGHSSSLVQLWAICQKTNKHGFSCTWATPTLTSIPRFQQSWQQMAFPWIYANTHISLILEFNDSQFKGQLQSKWL